MTSDDFWKAVDKYIEKFDEPIPTVAPLGPDMESATKAILDRIEQGKSFTHDIPDDSLY